jgi:antitoxin component of RelBE/YafQ-DinJ toxin-antitoxin module
MMKDKADKMLEEMGMNMTTYVTSSIKALLREKRVPHEIQTEQAFLKEAHREYVLAALAEAEREAAAPNAKRFTHAEIVERMEKRRDAKKRV